MKTKTTTEETTMKTTRYRHAKGCNWTTKHPDYRTMTAAGVPMVFGTGTRLEPCACYQKERAEEAQMVAAITAWHSPRMSRG